MPADFLDNYQQSPDQTIYQELMVDAISSKDPLTFYNKDCSEVYGAYQWIQHDTNPKDWIKT